MLSVFMGVNLIVRVMRVVFVGYGVSKVVSVCRATGPGT